MRILINGLVAQGARTGIGHYTAELVRCLRGRLGDDAVCCFQPDWGGPLRAWWGRLRGRSAPSAGWRGWLGAAVRRLGRAVCERRFRAVAAAGFDLYHEPNYIPLACDLPTVTTVHDLSVLLHPHWHPADRVAHFERHFRAGLDRCAGVLAVSAFTRREVIDHLGVAPERVRVTCDGCRPHLTPLPAEQVRQDLRSLGLPPRYLLCLGTIEPRKNVLLLLRAYTALPGMVRARYPLLLVGGWGWSSADVFAYLHDEARHRGVLHVGYVADEHLATLYNGARALVFPSHYEGFGMPAIEMMACGGAVIASTAGALVETVGAKAHLVDPADRDGWREALLRVTTDDDWWRQLRHGVEDVARPFTWERCADDTIAAYRLALAGRPRRGAA